MGEQHQLIVIVLLNNTEKTIYITFSRHKYLFPARSRDS